MGRLGGGRRGSSWSSAGGFLSTSASWPSLRLSLRPRLRLRLRCRRPPAFRRRPLLPHHVDESSGQIDPGLLDAPMTVGLDDLPNGIGGVAIGHLVLPIERHGRAGLDHVRELGVEVVRRRHGVVLGGVGVVGGVDRRIVVGLGSVVLVEEDGGVDGGIVGGRAQGVPTGIGRNCSCSGSGGGGLGHLLRISDGTREAQGPEAPGLPEEVGHGHLPAAGEAGTAPEHGRGGAAAHEADGVGLRRDHVDAGAAPVVVVGVGRGWVVVVGVVGR
mmetsp:Transcript_32768/g.96603  ORF Transcript_32768/g.96603 Transcript_32768/m.96603 type:complete len:272 (-) Transcript_32768:610-1425(-)